MLKDNPTVRAYRDFCWKLNMDPTKTRPLGEALLRRVLHAKQLPRISTVVDAYNLVSTKTMIPISGFDEDKLNPRPKLVPSIPELEKLLDIPTIEELEKVLKEKIPDLTIPKWSMDLPTADDFVDLVKGFFEDWGIFNWMRDAIAWAIGNWEYWIWDSLFRPRGLEKMKELLGKTQDRINDRMEKIREILLKIKNIIASRISEAVKTPLNVQFKCMHRTPLQTPLN